MNKLDHVMNKNIKNKNQCNDATKYEPKFDNIFSLSSGTKDPLSVVTVRLQGSKNHRGDIMDGLTCLWDSGYNYSMLKRQHTKPYEHNMRSNGVE